MINLFKHNCVYAAAVAAVFIALSLAYSNLLQAADKRSEINNCSTQNACIEQAIRVEKAVKNDELVRRGKDMRVAIDKTCEELRKTNKLHLQNYISDLVLEYIPLESSFEDAELIMRAAGLKIRTQVYTAHTSSMIGWIDISDKFLAASASIVIDLSPSKANDFSSSIRAVGAIITYATL